MLGLTLKAGFERDVKLLIASVGIVSMAGGFAQVAQSIYLAMVGIPPILIGLTASVSTVAYSLRMLLFGILSDRIGRRKVLFIMSITSAAYYGVYFLAREFPFFLLAAIIGGVVGGKVSEASLNTP